MTFDWATQLLRLSIFSDAPVTVSEKDWKTITGQDEAETRTAIPGGKSYIGNFAGGQLSFTYTGPRIDINLSAAAIEQDPSKIQQLPGIIGPWNEFAETFPKMVGAYLGGLKFPVLRLAFGSILLCEAKSREDTYEKLRELLVSVAVDAKNMRELIYRINWPQMSKVIPELELNRITSWSAIRIAHSRFQVTDSQLSVATVGEQQQFVRLEIDNSTNQTNKTPFEQAKLMAIFEELVMMARENAASGERP